MTKRIWARAALIVLLMILAVGSIASISGALSDQFRHSNYASAYGSTDPIATGNWQQDQYDSIIVADSQNQGLSPFVVKGQIMLESGFNTYATSQVINAGCGWTHDEGLMQVNPFCQGTGSANLFDPSTNIHYGTLELGSFVRQLGSIDLALQAYNIGLLAVLNGQRNWEYSSRVEAYAQQFTNEHCALYGCGSSGHSQSTSTTTTSTTSQSATTTTTQTLTTQTTTSSTTTTTSDCTSLAKIGIQYTVQQGDTLSCISQKTGLSIAAIAKMNNLGVPYVIFPGEVLSLSPSGHADIQSSARIAVAVSNHEIGDPRLNILQFAPSSLGAAFPLSINQENVSTNASTHQGVPVTPLHSTASQATTTSAVATPAAAKSSTGYNGGSMIAFTYIFGILALAALSLLLFFQYRDRGFVSDFSRRLEQLLLGR